MGTAVRSRSKSKTEQKLGFGSERHYNASRFELAPPLRQNRRLTLVGNVPRGSSLTQEQFDRLLAWLDADKDKAGQRYNWIQYRLIKIFASRGSTTPEDLADQTMDRVGLKLAEIQETYAGNPVNYFYGVAKNVFRESLHKEKHPIAIEPTPVSADEDEERDLSCLEKCMTKLPQSDRDLVLAYYQEERKAKIDNRKQLAQKLGLGMNALRIRACRIRAALQQCMEKCRDSEAIEMSK